MKGLMYKILRVIYEPPPFSYSNELRGLVGKLLSGAGRTTNPLTPFQKINAGSRVRSRICPAFK